MTIAQQAIEAGGVTPPATVKVWDPFVRVFHWSLVGLFIAAFATGDEVERVHIMVGYAIAALVGLRIVWGFIGTRHARFSDFVKSPGTVVAYLKGATSFKGQRYLGHNPAGGIMILLLLATLIGTCTTGYMMTTRSGWGSHELEEVHEAFANGMLVLIGLHIVGVIWASVEHGENLARAMITGRKKTGTDTSHA
ncbi:cytochrome B561 [Rhodomicrobium udaipurense JA643]|uniref:Cytochrome b/b6 domain-containing protein n=1 Tax=Rhodomicrobium udaipurense TaxID=1202716 RepID=A0A8I1KJ50_9HYPH|nr:cytochrome b/b6 domain-containing protein [Rhodomicrobium udaipurense]KAI94328.1 cytochrome B561 [Rhodomicrobium udaipurense JA643]MBJ7543372.1 cytochrome b/b6 domain-containing protein [Rhodomicrobium udaipurense]